MVLFLDPFSIQSDEGAAGCALSLAGCRMYAVCTVRAVSCYITDFGLTATKMLHSLMAALDEEHLNLSLLHFGWVTKKGLNGLKPHW